MAALRCTRKLLDRLGAGAAHAGGAGVEVEPTTVLGDWYATVFVVARRPLVLAAAERSLCPVVLPLKEARTLVPRWREAVGRKLAALGVAPPQIAAERAALAGAVVVPASYKGPHAAAGRRMVGVLTDMLYHLYHCEPHVVRLHTGPGLRASGLTLPDAMPELGRHGRSTRPAAVRAAWVCEPGRGHPGSVRGGPVSSVNHHLRAIRGPYAGQS